MIQNLNDAFKTLANPERRQFLLALAADTPRQDPSADRMEAGREYRVRMSHVHLPMLEAAEIIERCEDDREITRGPEFDEIRPLLQVVDENTNRVGATDER